jgi:hypothetical protein
LTQDDETTKELRPKIHSIRNISGGLEAWHAQVDPTFPKY